MDFSFNGALIVEQTRRLAMKCPKCGADIKLTEMMKHDKMHEEEKPKAEAPVAGKR